MSWRTPMMPREFSRPPGHDHNAGGYLRRRPADGPEVQAGTKKQRSFNQEVMKVTNAGQKEHTGETLKQTIQCSSIPSPSILPSPTNG